MTAISLRSGGASGLTRSSACSAGAEWEKSSWPRTSRLERKVALKRPSVFIQNPDRLRRFEREAKAASALNHPNILTIHEIGEADGAHYIISEFVDARPAGSDAARDAEPDRGARRSAAGGRRARGCACGRIVHRDIKPENVMARPDGLIKVLDFGLARFTERPAASSESDSQAVTLSQLSTEPGMVDGDSQLYVPEQARGQR